MVQKTFSAFFESYPRFIQKVKRGYGPKNVFQPFLSPYYSLSRHGLETQPELQSSFNELEFYVKPYLTPCTSFVLSLLIFKYHG